MHLIQDENGNLVPHGHEHTHEDGTVHSHTHAHSHEESSCDGDSRSKTLALLKYMLDHNGHHAEELAEMADSLENDKAVAEEILEAVAEFRKGNERLANAVKLMEK